MARSTLIPGTRTDSGGSVVKKLLWWAFGVFCGAVASALVAAVLPLSQVAPLIGWHVSHKSLRGNPTCDDTGWLRPVVPVKTEAYHQLRDYPADNLDDGNHNTAWVMPFPTGDKRQWVKWTLPKQASLRLVCLSSGYSRDYHGYATNQRLRQVTLSLDGCPPLQVSFNDLVDARQRVLLPGWNDSRGAQVNCKTKSVQLNVDSTYPATDHSGYVGVSDVRFYQTWP